MSVSAGGDNIDLNAIVSGGDSFLARIRQLVEAKATAEAAFEQLNVGRDANAALVDAQKSQQLAKDALEKAQDEAISIVTTATSKAAQIIGEATEAAARIAAEASAKTSVLEADIVSARGALATWSEQVKTEAEALLDQARSKHARAEQALAAAGDKQQSVDALHSDLTQQLAAAQTAEANFQAKVEAIKSAIS